MPFMRLTLAAVALLATAALVFNESTQAVAGSYREPSPPELFYNYYVPPGGCGGVGAQLYLSPRPTPPLVGHTYVTYQPLLPHESLYQHHKTYRTYNPDAGWTTTDVTWGARNLPTKLRRALIGPN